jgi:hypothetical protein
MSKIKFNEKVLEQQRKQALQLKRMLENIKQTEQNMIVKIPFLVENLRLMAKNASLIGDPRARYYEGLASLLTDTWEMWRKWRLNPPQF